MAKSEIGPKEQNLHDLRKRRTEEGKAVQTPIAPLLPAEQEHVDWVLARARQLGVETSVRMLLKLGGV